MSDLNQIAVTGRVGNDLEVRYTAGGMAVCEIRFAVSGRRKVGGQWEDTTTWLRTSCFDKRAEALSKLIRKGSRIGVQGTLVVREFDRKDGTRGTSVEVDANDIVLLDAKRDGDRPRDQGGAPHGGDDIPFAPMGDVW